MLKLRSIVILSFGAASLLLSACSGNGGSSTSNSTIPVVPQGSWNSINPQTFGSSNSLGFINFITANNNQVAIAGTNTSMQPALIICKNGTSLCGNYTNAGLSDVSAISAVEFDKNNNLFGTFIVPQDDNINPNRAVVMELPASGQTWLTFNSTNGNGLGLNVTSDVGILSSSGFAVPTSGFGYSHFGSVYLYNSQAQKITNNLNLEASSLSYVTSDGLGKVYVAGLDYYNSVVSAESSHVWNWNYQESSASKAFAKINTTTTFMSISGLSSNNQGVIYISGMDTSAVTHVWQYNGQQLSDLQFPGYTIKSITYMPQGNSGYLIVGGIDKELNGQVWSYNTQIESWATLSIPDSGDVGVVAVDNSNNHLYVAGSTGRGTSWLWSYF